MCVGTGQCVQVSGFGKRVKMWHSIWETSTPKYVKLYPQNVFRKQNRYNDRTKCHIAQL